MAPFSCIRKAFKKRFDRDRTYYRIVDELFGICPNNIELYKLALLHRSASVFLADGTHLNNERLEFLGDAVLEAVVSEFLFIEFPKADEGMLTRLRSKIVSRNSLNDLAQRIGLDRHIIQHANGTAIQKHIAGDAFEAMIGAIYLDQGYECINKVLLERIFRHHLDLDTLVFTETDYKSRLIEWGQKNRQNIAFITKRDSNYTATHPMFRSTVVIDGIEVGHGTGDSKKEAEQHAASAVSQIMSDEVGSYILDSLDDLTQSHKEDERDSR